MSKTYEPHPLSLVMPPMSDDEYFQLINSIVAHGQMEPIVILDGLILDGRHRYAACRKLGIEPIIREYSYEDDGPSPATFSLVKNTHRRHLTTSQRAMVAAAILPFFEAEAKANLSKAAAKTIKELAQKKKLKRSTVMPRLPRKCTFRAHQFIRPQNSLMKRQIWQKR